MVKKMSETLLIYSAVQSYSSRNLRSRVYGDQSKGKACAYVVDVLNGELGGLVECPLRRVDLVVGAVGQDHADARYGVPREAALLAVVQEALLDARHERLGDVGAGGDVLGEGHNAETVLSNRITRIRIVRQSCKTIRTAWKVTSWVNINISDLAKNLANN